MKRLSNSGRPSPYRTEKHGISDRGSSSAPASERRNGTVDYDKLARHLLRALGQIGGFARWRWSCDHG
jgi:hypothetical protein